MLGLSDLGEFRGFRWLKVYTLAVGGSSSCTTQRLTNRPKAGLVYDLGLSENWGYLVWGGPYNKDPTIQGTILGSPIFGNPHLSMMYWSCADLV